ncbi:MAG: hypothetical protein ABJA71_08370 [Ginsengibacter sp.]
MKHFLLIVFIFISTVCFAQKYALVDKQMSLPVTYANTITVQDNYKGYFPIEKNKLIEFISEVEKIARLLSDPKKPKPETVNFNVGSTTFHGLRVPLATEERMDIVITTDYGVSKTNMHLSDAKISNTKNAFYITTWLKYLRSYIK